MKRIYRILMIVHAFVGIGAIGGGIMAILNPQGPGGMPADALQNSPFSNYLIPGIILFTVIGLGNIFASVTILLKSKYQGYISSVFSWALVIWIIVQCIMLRAVAFLHVLYLIIGLIEAFLSFLILLNQRLFPAGIVFGITKYAREKFPENKLIRYIIRVESFIRGENVPSSGANL